MEPPETERRAPAGAPLEPLHHHHAKECKAAAAPAQAGRPALRPYQIEAIEKVAAAVAAGHRRNLLVMPTGSGKTVVAAAIISDAVAIGGRALFLAHRRELISQASNKLHAAGVDHGVILADHPTRPGEQVQVASVATLHARAFRSRSIDTPGADLIVIDEAHHCRARTYRRIIEDYPNAVILGITATPCRGDGRGLGGSFDVLIEGPSVAELIRLGFLVPCKVFAPTTPDLDGVKVARGDYVETELAGIMNTTSLVGDVVSHWLRLSERRPTVIFATNVAHSVHLRDEFRRAGVMAEHIDGSTLADERDGILRGLAAGKVEVISNVAVLGEGWDAPAASCLVLARPTRQIGLYRQMIGRVLRPAPNKVDALILDHSGAVFRHGFPDDAITWTLQPDKRAENSAQSRRDRYQAPSLQTCPECSAVRLSGHPCPACGWRPRPKAQAVDIVDGDLVAVDRQRRAQKHVADDAERRRFHRMLIGIARERGYRPGWAAYKFKEKFGAWPLDRFAEPLPPDDATRAWVRSRQIAYAKSLGNRGAE